MGKAKKPSPVLNSGGVQVTFPGGFGRAAEKFVETIRAKVRDIEARTIARLRKLEVRRQENIESILRKAVDELPPPEQISERPVNEDWTSRFFQECQDISDEQMQQIWARILANEVARPGSFSPRTLSVVRDLTKSDANWFATLCEFIWIVPVTGLVPIIHNYDALHVAEAELGFGVLTHLTSIGLIEFSAGTLYLSPKDVTEIAMSYRGRIHQLKTVEPARPLPLGHVIFTAVGAELAPISNAQGNDEYEKAALDAWSTLGWMEELSLPAGAAAF